MKAIITFLVFVSVYTTGTNLKPISKPTADDILGEWLTAHKDGHVLIYKKDKKYYGKIIWGVGYPEKDVKNQDPKLRTRDLIGLNILSDFVYDGDNAWEDGTIYLPGAGKSYSCVLTLKSVDALKVRGYVGSTLFGKTEYWTRIKK